jgi:RNA polymerase sigma factor (sigma-70 family)
LVNICRDYWRYQRRHPAAEPLDEVETRESATETWDLIEERHALGQLLGELTPQQREVVVLRFYLDQSVADTAELLGIAEGTVKSSAHRGLAQLRGLLSTPTNEVRHVER